MKINPAIVSFHLKRHHENREKGTPFSPSSFGHYFKIFLIFFLNRCIRL